MTFYKTKNKIYKNIFYFVLLYMVFCVSQLYAATSQDNVRIAISPRTVLVGDVITMDIFIKHEPEFSLYLPDLIDLTPFDIISTEVKKIKKDSDTFSQASFKVAVYQSGVFFMPSINFLLKSENKRIEVSTPPRNIKVTSILNKSKNFLVDIHPPNEIRQSFLNLLIYVWAATLCLFAALVLYIRKKRKRKKPAPVEPVIKEDPKIAAMSMLQSIFSSENLTKSTNKEICEKISFTIRYFFKEKFNIDTLEMTSCELVEYLDKTGLKYKDLAVIYELLMDCDMVKFANAPLYKDTAHKLKDYAVAIVQEA